MSEQISPAPVAVPEHEGFHRLLSVEALLFTSTVAVIAVTILSTLARRSRNLIVKALFTTLSTLYIPLVTYTLAVTENLPSPSPLLIVSVVLLQLIVSKTSGVKVKIDGGSNDNKDENTSNIDRDDEFDLIQYLADAGWLGFLFSSYENDELKNEHHTIQKDLMVPVAIVLALNVSNVLHTSLAKKLATRSFAVGRNANLVAGYMAAELPNQHEQEVEAYLVLGEEKLKRVITERGYRIITTTNNEDSDKHITLDKIWSCKRNLFLHNEKNREVCLSFALYKLLRLRFEGMQISKSNSERAINLVLNVNGLLRDHKRAFRVVEMELAFLDDYLYSEIPFTYHGAFIPINILHCLCFLSSCCYISWRVVQRLIAHDSYLKRYYNVLGSQLKLTERSSILLYFDAIVCLIIVFVAGYVQTIKVLTYVFSDQVKVVLLCKYAMNKPCTRLAIEAIELLNPKKIISYLRRKKIVLKEKQVKQFSLCQEKETSIDLPDEVKKAVIDSLVRNGGVRHSPNCRRVINVPGAEEACQLTNDTERILVWHIATSHCEDQRPVAKTAMQSDNRKVASILSRYCAYLVASAPELLPDGTVWNRFIVKGVKEEIAQLELRGQRTWRITKLMDKIRNVLHMEDERDPPKRPAQVYGKGKELGGKLIEVIEDGGILWKALAELWADMLLCVALSNDLNAHAESIAKGGEFITHVWALLSNVGINEHRDQPNSV